MPMPEMIPVSSSNLLGIGYDLENKEVYVWFINGSVYVYRGVEEYVFEEFRTAPSHGSYLHRNFKNNYSYERIE